MNDTVRLMFQVNLCIKGMEARTGGGLDRGRPRRPLQVSR